MFEVADEQQAGNSNGPVHDRVLHALRRGAVLLVPHARAARVWAATFDLDRATSGEKSWQAANILPWNAWTASLWNHAAVHGIDSRVVLNDLQETAVWKEVIARSDTASLQPMESHARLCSTALRLLGSYDTAGRFAGEQYSRDGLTADAAVFADWYLRFEQNCAENSYLPLSHLHAELASLIQAKRLQAGGEYLLCGFQSLTPAQELLVSALRSAGAEVSFLAPTTARGKVPCLVRCGSPREELQACARWVRQRLHEDASASLAVVVPDLGTARPELERELRAIVAPHIADVTCKDTLAPYEFSSSRELRHLPMIADALLLLRWCGQDISVEDAGRLLRSRHLLLAGGPETGAELEMQVLRRLPSLRGSLSLSQVARAFARESAANREGTAHSLGELELAAQACRSAANSYAWFAARAHDLLRTAGWPGPGTLDSDEFQAVSRWNELLDQLASLDLLGKEAGMSAFLLELAAAAATTQFAPENRAAPVQVITVREAAGTTADALWFLHADAATWPSHPSVHPLLPLRLQRDLQMPGTDFARDEEEAAGTLDQLLQSAPEVCFSYSSAPAEGKRDPAPLVERLIEREGGQFRDNGENTGLDEPPCLLVTALDRERLPPLPDSHVSGGVSVLTAQAQCGFKAFAEKRLFAAAGDEPEAGLSPGERGDQVHKVLQAFWDRVGNQQELKDKTARRDGDGVSERDSTLRECIQQQFRASSAHLWDAAYLAVQRQRLFRLLTAWLDFEAGRPAFEVVHLEKEIKDVAIGPLRLNMRVDRVDHVTSDDGEGTVLIDYKTGPASPRDWLGERPDQPQLPAYAVAGALAAGLDRVDALAFGAVRVGSQGMRMDGLAEVPSLLKPVPRDRANFADCLADWRRDLERLATDFAEGDASVQPKQYPNTCERCTQRMLCRVDAATLLQIEDLEPEAEEDEAAAWT